MPASRIVGKRAALRGHARDLGDRQVDSAVRLHRDPPRRLEQIALDGLFPRYGLSNICCRGCASRGCASSRGAP